MTAHALTWHIMLVFIGFYLTATKHGSRSLKGFSYTIVLYYILAAIAVIINLSLDNASKGEINMFFLGSKGPGVIVFQGVFERCGWVVSTIFFTAIVTLGAFICYFIGWFINKKRTNVVSN